MKRPSRSSRPTEATELKLDPMMPHRARTANTDASLAAGNAVDIFIVAFLFVSLEWALDFGVEKLGWQIFLRVGLRIGWQNSPKSCSFANVKHLMTDD